MAVVERKEGTVQSKKEKLITLFNGEKVRQSDIEAIELVGEHTVKVTLQSKRKAYIKGKGVVSRKHKQTIVESFFSPAEAKSVFDDMLNQLS